MPFLALARRQFELLGEGALRVSAPAKLNLNLLVGPLRTNGYHSLDSYVAKVALYDELTLRCRDDGRLTFACEGADCGADEQNLALRAARSLQQRVLSRRPPAGADMRLSKRIPPGAGLGGGSSDAAAALLGLQKLWGLDFVPEDLAALAAGLGSDVPLFLDGPACRMTGRGEAVEPVAVHDLVAVVIFPDVGCPTRVVYRAYDDVPHELPAQLDAAQLRRLPSEWRGLLRNDLAEPACRVSPAFAEAFDAARDAAGLPVHVSGSGSALFMLCDDEDEARRAISGLPEALRSRAQMVRRNPW